MDEYVSNLVIILSSIHLVVNSVLKLFSIEYIQLNKIDFEIENENFPKSSQAIRDARH